MRPLCRGTPRWWGVEKTTYSRWWFPSLGSTVCRCWYCSNHLADRAVVLLPCEACCHEPNAIVDLVGNLVFPVVVETIQPFEVGSTKLCCLNVLIESEVLTCCCCLDSWWWHYHRVGCHSSCCSTRKTLKAKHCWNKTASLEHSMLSTFLLTFSSKVTAVVQQNVELMKQIKAKHVEFLAESHVV